MSRSRRTRRLIATRVLDPPASYNPDSPTSSIATSIRAKKSGTSSSVSGAHAFFDCYSYVGISSVELCPGLSQCVTFRIVFSPYRRHCCGHFALIWSPASFRYIPIPIFATVFISLVRGLQSGFVICYLISQFACQFRFYFSQYSCYCRSNSYFAIRFR